MDTLHVARRELNKFETAIKYFHYPSIYVDLGGDILTYNQEFAHMLNRPPIEDSDQRIQFSDLVAVEDRASVISHYQKILLGAGKAVRDQYPLLSTNREKVTVDSAGTLLEDTHGAQYGMLFTFQPIRSLPISWKEIEYHLYKIKHELKSPLNAMMGFAELLLSQQNLNSEAREYGHYIYESGIHMLRLIESVAEVPESSGQHLRLSSEWFSLEKVFSFISYFGDMLIRRTGKDISLRAVHPPDVDIHVFGDQKRLKQVIINLVHNAIKFTETGEIEFGVEENEKEEYEFFVRDTGIGIPEEKQRQVFLPFYGVGDGIGLSTAKEFVEEMGGEMYLYSAPYEGSEFYFTLPPYRAG
ncbi:MAG: ATP-binding protein [Spirochaetota bacterium]